MDTCLDGNSAHREPSIVTAGYPPNVLGSWRFMVAGEAVDQWQRTNAGRFALCRRDLITMFGGAAVAWPLAVGAQEKGRTYRIGVLSIPPQGNAIFDALRWRGFVEGQNLQVDAAGYGLQPGQLAQHAAELVRAKVDLIYSNGSAPIRAAQEPTKTIPIVGVTDDMVGEGLAVSLAHPGANTTSVSMLSTELDGKRQQLLIDLLPGARRIAARTDSGTTLPSEIQP